MGDSVSLKLAGQALALLQEVKRRHHHLTLNKLAVACLRVGARRVLARPNQLDVELRAMAVEKLSVDPRKGQTKKAAAKAAKKRRKAAGPRRRVRPGPISEAVVEAAPRLGEALTPEALTELLTGMLGGSKIAAPDPEDDSEDEPPGGD